LQALAIYWVRHLERPIACPPQTYDKLSPEMSSNPPSVRLWIASTLEQNGEVSRGHAIDAGPKCIHGRGRPDERDSPVALQAIPVEESVSNQLKPASFELEDQRADVRGESKHLEIPLAQAAGRVETGFQHALGGRV
jgi:hypothetical protein